MNDPLFPKVTAETISAQSKGFTKPRKTHDKMPQGREQTGGGTGPPKNQLGKDTPPCRCLGGSRRLVLKGATGGVGDGMRQGGVCPVHTANGEGWGQGRGQAFADFLAKMRLLFSPPHHHQDK